MPLFLHKYVNTKNEFKVKFKPRRRFVLSRKTHLDEIYNRIRAIDMLKILKKRYTYDHLATLTKLPITVLNRYVKGHVLPSVDRANELLKIFRKKFDVKKEINDRIKFDKNGLDGERTFVCSQYVGIARTAFEIGTKYANLRVQFQKRLRDFEGISFKISEMYAKLEAGRLMMLRAARMLDDGLNATKEVAAAKFTCANNQMEIVLEAMQILGGIGYTKEMPLEQLLRDSKISQISAGTVEILKFLCQREIYKALKL